MGPFIVPAVLLLVANAIRLSLTVCKGKRQHETTSHIKNYMDNLNRRSMGKIVSIKRIHSGLTQFSHIQEAISVQYLFFERLNSQMY